MKQYIFDDKSFCDVMETIYRFTSMDELRRRRAISLFYCVQQYPTQGQCTLYALNLDHERREIHGIGIYVMDDTKGNPDVMYDAMNELTPGYIIILERIYPDSDTATKVAIYAASQVDPAAN